MPAHVRIDPELCIGSAECVRIAPAAFRLDDARGVSVPTDAAESEDPALLREAVQSCPTGAIAFHSSDPGDPDDQA